MFRLLLFRRGMTSVLSSGSLVPSRSFGLSVSTKGWIGRPWIWTFSSKDFFTESGGAGGGHILRVLSLLNFAPRFKVLSNCAEDFGGQEWRPSSPTRFGNEILALGLGTTSFDASWTTSSGTSGGGTHQGSSSSGKGSKPWTSSKKNWKSLPL